MEGKEEWGSWVGRSFCDGKLRVKTSWRRASSVESIEVLLWFRVQQRWTGDWLIRSVCRAYLLHGHGWIYCALCNYRFTRL